MCFLHSDSSSIHTCPFFTLCFVFTKHYVSNWISSPNLLKKSPKTFLEDFVFLSWFSLQFQSTNFYPYCFTHTLWIIAYYGINNDHLVSNGGSEIQGSTLGSHYGISRNWGPTTGTLEHIAPFKWFYYLPQLGNRRSPEYITWIRRHIFKNMWKNSILRKTHPGEMNK